MKSKDLIPATERATRIVVLGMGNQLLKDEGIGVHVARALEGTASPDNVSLEIIDGGTLPDAPLAFESADKLIVVDAVKADGEPGAIYRFHLEDVRLKHDNLTSLHQVSLLESLWMMERFGQKPKEIVIIGIEPGETDWGLDLSPVLRELFPRVLRVVREEIGFNDSYNSEKGEL